MSHTRPLIVCADQDCATRFFLVPDRGARAPFCSDCADRKFGKPSDTCIARNEGLGSRTCGHRVVGYGPCSGAPLCSLHLRTVQNTYGHKLPQHIPATFVYATIATA